MKQAFLLIAVLLLTPLAALHAAEPIVIADFEGDTYGNWKTTGEAFGPGPAKGTLPGQMPVDGYEGKGLVNSFYGGDKSTGTLTSPPLKIQRRYINFLIGGGMHPGETCMNLLVGGKVARTATGPNERPGGSEHLDWCTWDVGDLAGKEAVIEIVDRATGGWGHISVDQIVQSDTRKAEPTVIEPIYHERYRPQFHFSPRINWTNDPNGLVFYQGEYHLFFQHNPTGINWGNMTWGHAVSPDLLHWEQLGHAIHPDKLGTIYSGSAVVDGHNTAGFQTGKEKVIVCIFTSAGNPYTQSIAYSNDRGRTWTKYAKNPVLGNQAPANRDPKVIWHAATKKWVMALYLDGPRYALFGSANLKEWKKLSDVPASGATECPDLFELPVDGDAKHTQWVFWGGNNHYLLGRFDGTTFTKEAGPLCFEYGANYYAAQSYSGIPKEDGRRIQIAWMAGGLYPKMPFNQQMSLPSVLTLRTFADGVRMCREPVKEIEKLRGKQHRWSDLAPAAGENPLKGISGELFDVRAEIEPGTEGEVTLMIRGTPLRYDAKAKELVLMGKRAPLEPVDGKIRLRVLVDRSSIEAFGNDGRVSLSNCFLPPVGDKSLALGVKGKAVVKSLAVWELKSTWK